MAGKGVAVSQMLAAIGQSRLMHAYQELFAERGVTVAQALLSGGDVDRRVGYLNVRNTLTGLLERGIVPIINENDVVDTTEINDQRFRRQRHAVGYRRKRRRGGPAGDGDGHGGLYSADPNRDASAKLIERVESIDDSVMALAEEHRSSVTRGGMVSKLEATKRATAVGVTVVFAGGDDTTAVRRAACGEPVGTLFPTAVSSLEGRKRWLRSGMTRKGTALIVDDGARKALVENERSLLPAGVREVRGEFVGATLSKSSRRPERVSPTG